MISALVLFKKGLIETLSYKTAVVLTVLGTLVGIANYGFMASFLQKGNSFPVLSSYGGDLLSYLITGSAFMSFVSLSLTSFQTTIRSEQEMGTLEYLLISRTPLEIILFCSGLWNLVFTSINVILLFGVAAIAFDAPLNINLISVILILFLTILSMSGIGLASAGVIMVTKKGDPINWIFVTFSGLVSGVFFPIEILPVYLQNLALALPTTHALTALRLAVSMNANLTTIKPQIMFLILSCIITVPLGLIMFRCGTNKSIKDGTLSEY